MESIQMEDIKDGSNIRNKDTSMISRRNNSDAENSTMRANSPINEDTFDESPSKHDIVWTLEVTGKRRVISQGDLKYDLDDNILAVLPFYSKDNMAQKMKVVTGTIIDINNVILPQYQDSPGWRGRKYSFGGDRPARAARLVHSVSQR